MRYFILLLCAATGCLANAQQHIAYAGSIEAGISKGSNPANSFVYTTQGIAFKQYAFSLGTGFDFYALHSIPLFADVKKRFNGRGVQPFLHASAGVNFTNAASSNAKFVTEYNGEGKFNSGFFAKGGGGFIFRAEKRWQLSLSAGYSYKTSSYHYKPFAGTPWLWQIQPVKDIYHFNCWYVETGILW